MSKLPEESKKFSPTLQKRLIEFINDEEFNESGKPCSNAEFSDSVGISKTVISNIVNYGIIPTLKTLIKIADYLNTSIEYLAGKTDNCSFAKSEANVTFHERIMQLKNERQVKYADIANNCTFTGNSIHVWLKRKDLPTLEYAFQIADYFKVSIDYLLGRTDYINN